MMKDNNYQVIVVDDDKQAARAFAELIEAKLKISVRSETEPNEVLKLVAGENIKVNAARKSKVDDNTARMQSIKQLGV